MYNDFWEHLLIRVNHAGWKNLDEFLAYVLNIKPNTNTSIILYVVYTFLGTYERTLSIIENNRVYLEIIDINKNHKYETYSIKMKHYIKDLDFGHKTKNDSLIFWISIPLMEKTNTIPERIRNYTFTETDYDMYNECKDECSAYAVFNSNSLYFESYLFVFDNPSSSNTFQYWYISRFDPNILEKLKETYKKEKETYSGNYTYLAKYNVWVKSSHDNDCTYLFCCLNCYILQKVKKKSLIRIFKRFINENYDIVQHTLYNPENGIMMKLFKSTFENLCNNLNKVQ